MVSPSPTWLRAAAALILVAMLAAACSSEEAPAVTDEPSDAGTAEPPADEAPAANLTDGCADPALADADVEWFPEQVTFDVASGISVTYDGNVKTVTIDEPTDAPDAEPFTLALVQCGTDAGDVAADAIVEVPVDSVATYSTTFLQGFELIDRLDALSAHGGLMLVSSEAVTGLAESGDVAEVGDQTAPDLETLAAAEPDVVMVSAGFGGADAAEPFAALDVPVIPNASYLEGDPVGRAEWMKLEALLLNEEGAVNEVFDGIAADYAELADLTADVAERPRVLTSSPFEGSWFVSGGDSYNAQLIAAAGGEYVFADLSGPTQPLDLEVVLDRAEDADVWLAAGSVSLPPDALLADDERLGEFAAYPDAVWANDADLGPSGGNRIFEDGAVRPDLVLADLIAILHPDLLPDHDIRFYGQLGSQLDGTPGSSG